MKVSCAQTNMWTIHLKTKLTWLTTYACTLTAIVNLIPCYYVAICVSILCTFIHLCHEWNYRHFSVRIPLTMRIWKINEHSISFPSRGNIFQVSFVSRFHPARRQHCGIRTQSYLSSLAPSVWECFSHCTLMSVFKKHFVFCCCYFINNNFLPLTISNSLVCNLW